MCKPGENCVATADLCSIVHVILASGSRTAISTQVVNPSGQRHVEDRAESGRKISTDRGKYEQLF